MDAPLIAPSARKHGIHDNDMIHAFNHPIFVDELDDGFTMIVGPNQSAIFLEVGVVATGDQAPHRPRHESPREVPEVMTMPRTVDEILQHADELAARFESYEPNPADELDTGAVALLRAAVAERSQAEASPDDIIRKAREAGALVRDRHLRRHHGEAARQRYGQSVNAS